MSIAQTENFARAMALLNLAKNAVLDCAVSDGPLAELADNTATTLKLVMELLEADHNAGRIGVEKS